MGYQVSSLDALGEGYGFRKVRGALGVTAFGVNALVFPPGYGRPGALPRPAGRALLRPPRHRDVRDRRRRARRRGGRPRPRRVDDAAPGLEPHATDDLVLFVVGGKGGYVERDGQLVIAGGSREARRRMRRATSMNGLMMDYQLTLPIAAPPLRGATSATRRSSRGCPTRASTATTYAETCRARARARGRRCRASASSAATASRRSAGTTTSTTRRTSASRAAASCCTR